MYSVRVKRVNKKVDTKLARRFRRKRRIRGRIKGTVEKPRVSIFRSNKNFSAQLIDDVAGVTICSVSSQEKDLQTQTNVTVETVKKLGNILSKRAQEKNIKTVVFDRNGYRFHGIVKAFADSMREGILF